MEGLVECKEEEYWSGSDKDLLVYHRRSLQEREEASNRMLEREAIQRLEELGDVPVYTQIMALPTPRPFPRKNRFVRHQRREGGPIELLPYCVPPNLEEKVTAGVILCMIKKGIQFMAKRVKEALNGKAKEYM
jgi:hypothetical protein